MIYSRRRTVAGIAALLALPASRALALPEPQSTLIRRHYLDGPFGQIHVRIARPVRGPADRPPMLLLHQSPLSGRMFDRILPLLADRRMVIALDTPGYGESDRPRERPSLAQYGDAIIESVLKLTKRPVDLVGYHTGAAIAAELAARRPRDCRRVVLISMPYFDAGRRAELIAQLGRRNPVATDGSHLPPLWTGTLGVKPPGQSLDDVARLVSEKQRVGQFGEWALLAAMETDFTPLLPKIRAPTLVMTPRDGLEDESRAAARRIPGAQVADLPAFGYGLFDAAPGGMARTLLAFLR